MAATLACRDRSTLPESSDSESPPPITAADYLSSSHWDDGRAEVAFYRVQRSQDQYGRPRAQRFLVGTYLVKHRFSPAEMTKTTDGSGVSALKYALFYELESGSYQYKRSWVVNARQRDLRPFKQSFTSFDWCSNQYRELAFPPEGPVYVRMRSDDYGNRRATLPAHARSYPPAQLPLLVRGLDAPPGDTLTFSVVDADSSAHVSARARHVGTDSVVTPAGTFEADRIVVHYDRPVPSPIAERSAEVETYWVGTGPERRLLRVEAQGGGYQMTLVEHLRSAYWEENIWTRLDRVAQRP